MQKRPLLAIQISKPFSLLFRDLLALNVFNKVKNKLTTLIS